MIKLRPATAEDVPALADLAELSRAEYARYEPDFWRPAATARLMHTPYLSFLVESADVTVLVAEQQGALEGFITARHTALPPGLDGEGRLCLVDDFTLRARGDWRDLGRSLLDEIVAGLDRSQPTLLLAVCGHRDRAKGTALLDAALKPDCSFRLKRLDARVEACPRIRDAEAEDAPALARLGAGRPPRRHGMQMLWSQPRGPEAYRAMIEDRGIISLVGEADGYAIGRPGLPAPPVYDPGGTTCLVDDLDLGESWPGCGPDLLAGLEAAARAAGDVQLLIACDRRESGKKEALEARGYRWPVDWYSRELPV